MRKKVKIVFWLFFPVEVITLLRENVSTKGKDQREGPKGRTKGKDTRTKKRATKGNSKVALVWWLVSRALRLGRV